MKKLGQAVADAFAGVASFFKKTVSNFTDQEDQDNLGHPVKSHMVGQVADPAFEKDHDR